MKKLKIIWRIIFSLLAMAITTALLYLAERFLDVQTVQFGNLKLMAQILIGTFGVFWIFNWISDTLKQNLYLVLGLITVVIALYYLASLSQLNIPAIKLLPELNVFETVTLTLCGIFYLIYGEIKTPNHQPHLKTSTA